MSNFCQMTQRTIKIGNMVERRITPYSVSFAQVKFSEKEAAMLRHDLCEVEVSLAQWGLMVVGLIYLAGEQVVLQEQTLMNLILIQNPIVLILHE